MIKKIWITCLCLSILWLLLISTRLIVFGFNPNEKDLWYLGLTIIIDIISLISKFGIYFCIGWIITDIILKNKLTDEDSN